MDFLALSRAFVKTGKSIAASSATMAIATNNSIKVNARLIFNHP
jgi:hypothetical protein